MRLELRRADGAPPLVIGHRGAAALAPENSLAALEAALELGVDLVELDVLARADGSLVLAHTRPERESPTLHAGLERLAAAAGTGLLLDLKAPGIEAAAVQALRRCGLLERTLACSLSVRALRRLAAAEPGLQRGLSYPDDRLGLAERPRMAPVVRAGLAGLRRALPWRAPRWLRATGVGALSLHWELVTSALVVRCHAEGAAVLAWTVPDREVANRLGAMGVDAMIADDPRFLMESSTPR
jgi:glycerophosphoryl diester phosphodiesterase